MGFLKWAVRIFGSIFLLAGLVLLAFSYDFASNAIKARGSVVDVAVEVSTGSSSDSVTYRPTVRYVDQTGQKRRGTTFMSSSSYNFDIGTGVDILYDPRDTASIRMDNWFALWGIGTIFAVVGVVIIAIAQLIGRKARTKQPDIDSNGRDRETGMKREVRPARRFGKPRPGKLAKRPDENIARTDFEKSSAQRSDSPTVRRRH